MSDLYFQLAERIRAEVPEVESTVHRSLAAWKQAQERPHESAYLDSVALNLHGFYSGVERLLELIARHVDQSLPKGETWHRELLLQMKDALADIRPAVIGEGNALALDEFRRFRHLVRNLYTMSLAPERMARLMSVLPELWSGLRSELLAFADFLEELTHACESGERD